MTTINQQGIIAKQETKKAVEATNTNAKASLRDVILEMQGEIAKALPKVFESLVIL